MDDMHLFLSDVPALRYTAQGLTAFPCLWKVRAPEPLRMLHPRPAIAKDYLFLDGFPYFLYGEAVVQVMEIHLHPTRVGRA